MFATVCLVTLWGGGIMKKVTKSDIAEWGGALTFRIFVVRSFLNDLYVKYCDILFY